MLITAVDAQFTLAQDLINNSYRTDLSLLSRNFLIENAVPNGGFTTLGSPVTNSSGAAYIRDTDKTWIMHNSGGIFEEYEGTDIGGTPIRTITMGGLSNNDSEGIVWMGYDTADDLYEFAVSIEGGSSYIVTIFRITLAQLLGTVDETFNATQELVIAPPALDNNSGPEGVAYDRFSRVFYVVGEGQQANTPRKFFRFDRPIDKVTDFTFNDPELVVTEPWDAEVIYAPRGATGFDYDLSDVFFHEGTGNVLIMSHTGTEVTQVDVVTGVILSSLSLQSSTQWEGLTLSGDDVIAVSEPNGFQLYNYVSP